ncbi:hypothetical protein [Euzebya rosea]|uniref:hypothetical protein n=1 Tax=Euzebya rosea TaxID=2052804 RepID=UPI0013007695|nr:hypothetical protein [Euzebya rosea]
MHRPLRIVLATVLALSALAGPAAAYYDEEREVEFVESTAWFTSTTTGVSNIDTEVLGERIGWSQDAPTGSAGRTVATAHAGLLSILSEDYYESQSFTAEGVVTGYMENIALQLYYTSPVQNLCGMGLSIDVVIDGKRVMDMAGIGNTEDVVTYQISDDHYVAQVAITNIAEQMESMGIFGAADTEHAVEIVAEQYPLCQEAIWTYGAAETPSNLTVNLEPGSAALRQYTQFDATNPPVSAE